MADSYYNINGWLYAVVSALVTLVFISSFIPVIAINQLAMLWFPELSLFDLAARSFLFLTSLNYLLFSVPLLVVIGQKFFRVFGVRVTPGTYSLQSKQGLSWWVSHAFLESSLRLVELINIPTLNKWLLRLLGAKVGKKTVVNGKFFDPSLIEIGDHTLTSHIIVSGHLQQEGKVVLAPVKIGSNCLIGYDTVILPGAVIDDDVVIGARSLVPMNMHVTKGVWTGTPVKKIR